AFLLATWFGAGLLPGMPGTWGSLAAPPCAWAIRLYAGPRGLAVAALAAFALGIWAAGVTARASGRHDPGFIVIDEVAAMFLVLAAAPPVWQAYGAACRARGWRVGTAESCTGGLVAAALTAVAGACGVVERGFVVYSNAAKAS